jgi:hypothetical protein
MRASASGNTTRHTLTLPLLIPSSLSSPRTDSPLTIQRFITANGSLTHHGGSSGKAHDLHLADAHFESHQEQLLF